MSAVYRLFCAGLRAQFPSAMLRVSFPGTLRGGVTSRATLTTPSVKEFSYDSVSDFLWHTYTMLYNTHRLVLTAGLTENEKGR